MPSFDKVPLDFHKVPLDKVSSDKVSSGKAASNQALFFNDARKLVLLAVLVSLASALHVLEALIPNPVPIPGAKLGLANIITLVTLILFGWKEGLVVVLLRVLMGSLLGGTFLGLGFLLGLSGAVFSLFIMCGLLRWVRSLSLVGISVGGAASHNLAQVAAAVFLTQTPSLGYFLPVLLLISVPTGIFTGIAAKTLCNHLGKLAG